MSLFCFSLGGVDFSLSRSSIPPSVRGDAIELLGFVLQCAGLLVQCGPKNIADLVAMSLLLSFLLWRRSVGVFVWDNGYLFGERFNPFGKLFGSVDLALHFGDAFDQLVGRIRGVGGLFARLDGRREGLANFVDVRLDRLQTVTIGNRGPRFAEQLGGLT